MVSWIPPCDIETAARLWASQYPSRGAAIREAVYLLQFDRRSLPLRDNDFIGCRGQWDKRVLQRVAGIA